MKKTKKQDAIMLKRLFTNRFFIPFVVFVMLPLALVVSKIVFATTPTFTEYSLPIATAHPTEIVAGPDGNLWFTEQQTSKIGKINPSNGNITEYTLPVGSPSLSPSGITVGSDGNLWFSAYSPSCVGKITTSGAITMYPLPVGMTQVNDIVLGPDNNLWFTAYASNKIGVMNLSGTFLRQYSVDGGPEGISKGPDGNIWFVEQNLNQVGKINLSSGVITTYSVSYLPLDTAAGPDGNVWFTGGYGNKIGKISPSTGAVSEYALPSKAGYGPQQITTGPDGNVWFTVSYTGLGMINPSTKAITLYASPSSAVGGAFSIATGPDKNIWYTVNNNYSKIGKANIGLSTVLGTANTGTGSTSTGSTGSGSTGTGSTSTGNTGTGSTGSGSTGTGSGDNSSTDPKDSKDKVIVIIQHDGTTKATVATGIKLDHKNYEVPAGQILYVDGSLGIVQVRNGASIKGSGKVNGLTVDLGAALAPGHSPGCLDSGNLTLLGSYQVEIAGLDVCKTYDQVRVSGSVYLNGMLEISWLDDFKPKVGQNFTIIKNDGNDPVNGQFIGIAEGHKFTSMGVTYSVTYKGGDGNDVVLNVAGLTDQKSEKLQSKLFTNAKQFILRNIAVLVSIILVTILIATSIILRYEKACKENIKPKKYLKNLAKKSKQLKKK